MSMMPNTSVSPAASRNSISPNCRPFSICSTIRMGDKKGARLAPRPFAVSPVASFHLAVFGPEVDVLAHHGGDLLVDDAPLGILRHDAQVVVLDRRAVRREFPVAARRLD